MLALILSTIAGFLCTSIALPLSQTLRVRRGYGFWTWGFALLQLIAGVAILAELVSPATMTIIDVSSAGTLRLILGFLAGVLSRIILALFATRAPLPSSILLPDGSPAQWIGPTPVPYSQYVGPVAVVFILLTAGALAPHLDRWFASLRSLDTPWASLTFATETALDRFDLEPTEKIVSASDLKPILDIRRAIARDAAIAKEFPESQEAAFQETWEPTILFFDRYLMPLSSCVSLLYDQNRNQKQISDLIANLPSNLERIRHDIIAIEANETNKDIDRFYRYYERSWSFLLKEIDEALRQANYALSPAFVLSAEDRSCYEYSAQKWLGVRPTSIMLPERQHMDHEAMADVLRNPYFAMALSTVYSSGGSMQTARDILKRAADEFQSDAPNVLAWLLYAEKRGGFDFHGYVDVQRQLIKAFDVRTARVSSGNVFKLSGPVCGMTQAGLSYYGGGVYSSIVQKNDFVFEVAKLLNSDDRVNQPTLDEADAYADEIKKFADRIVQIECAIKQQLERAGMDWRLFRAMLWDTYAVYKITRDQGSGADIEDFKFLLERALDYAEVSTAATEYRS